MMIKKLLQILSILVLLPVSVSTKAVMVESFDYTLVGGWVADGAVCDTGVGISADCVSTAGADMLNLAVTDPALQALLGGANVNVYSKISWGTQIDNGGQSSLTSWQNDDDNSEANGDLTGGGTVLADGTPRFGTRIQHDNNTIDPPYLLGVPFYEIFTITSTTPGITGPITPIAAPALFGVAFVETINLPEGDPDTDNDCIGGTPEPCQDFFVLLNEEDLAPEVEVCNEVPNGTAPPELDCWTYIFNISTAGLTTINTADVTAQTGIVLSPDQLAAAGDTVGLLTTQEGQANIFDFQFSARHAVPEPHTLALMLLGLLGLGCANKRRVDAG